MKKRLSQRAPSHIRTKYSAFNVVNEEIREHCSSKLYVVCNALDPDWVTQLLGIEPHKTWRKGEQAVVTAPDGRVKTLERTIKRGGWLREIEEAMKSSDVEAQLEYWCEILGTKMTAVQALRAEGCELNIDFYVSQGPVVYIALAPNLLEKFAQLGIELSFGIYDNTSSLKEGEFIDRMALQASRSSHFGCK